MKNYLEKKLVNAKCRAICAKWKMEEYAKNFLQNEKGAQDFVAIILLIVIIIAVATIFRDKLIELVNNVMGKLTDFVG